MPGFTAAFKAVYDASYKLGMRALQAIALGFGLKVGGTNLI